MLFQCRQMNNLMLSFLTFDEVCYILNKLTIISCLEKFAAKNGFISIFKKFNFLTLTDFAITQQAIIGGHLNILKLLIRKTNGFWIKEIFSHAALHNNWKVVKWCRKHDMYWHPYWYKHKGTKNLKMHRWLLKKGYRV